MNSTGWVNADDPAFVGQTFSQDAFSYKEVQICFFKYPKTFPDPRSHTSGPHHMLCGKQTTNSLMTGFIIPRDERHSRTDLLSLSLSLLQAVVSDAL